MPSPSTTVDGGHGRIETRQCWTTSDPEYLQYIASIGDWPGQQSIGMIEAKRQTSEGTTVKRRYLISTVPSNAHQLPFAVRTYWGIENKLHWVLDLAFREDECRVRKGNGPQNFAALRHIALNLLRREDTAKISIGPNAKKPYGIMTTCSRSQQPKCDCSNDSECEHSECEH